MCECVGVSVCRYKYISAQAYRLTAHSLAQSHKNGSFNLSFFNMSGYPCSSDYLKCVYNIYLFFCSARVSTLRHAEALSRFTPYSILNLFAYTLKLAHYFSFVFIDILTLI